MAIPFSPPPKGQQPAEAAEINRHRKGTGKAEAKPIETAVGKTAEGTADGFCAAPYLP